MEDVLLILGEKIRFLRKKQNISQTSLCLGICTQSYLSNIEKGQTSPSAFILNRLASRLGVSTTYLLQTDDKEQYIQDVIGLIRHEITRREYRLVNEILENEKLTLFKNNKLKQFYYWHKGICVFYNDRDIDSSLRFLDLAINLEEDSYINIKVELEILISKANILGDNKMYEEAIVIYKSIHEKISEYQITNTEKLYIKVYYNFSRILRLTQHFEEAINMCDKGINICLKSDLMYALGDLYFQKGLVLRLIDRKKLAKKAFHNALRVFELYNNTDFICLVHNELNKLKNIKNNK